MAADQEALVWVHTVEGLLRACQSRATPRWRERLRGAGLDLEKPLAPAYGREQWRDLITISSQELFTGTPEERFEQLGAAFIDQYAQTFIGRALAKLVAVIGPRRALERMTRSLRSGNNYSETRASFPGPGRAEFWLNETLGAPSYIHGALSAVMKLSGAKGVRVKTMETDGHAATFSVEWDP
jgi:uncharacterized protein (TIGR02265 family)